MTQSVLVQQPVAPTEQTPKLSPPPSPLRRFGRFCLHSLPTLLTFLVLAGVGFWGHHTGWKMPKFSSLMGPAEKTPDDWCAEHGVPESACVVCKPGLMPKTKDYGWCKTHGVSDCPYCHPEVAHVTGTPQLPKYDTLAALNLLERTPNNPQCKLYRRRIQFASQEAVDKAGIDVDVVQERPMFDALVANGEITYDPTTVARLSSKVSGTVSQVRKALGETVKAGEVLALVDAAEVGRAKTEYAQAVVQAQLKAKNYASLQSAVGAVPERAIREAEAALEEARLRVTTADQALSNLGLPLPAGWDKLDAKELASRLRFLGLPDEIVPDLAKTTTTANLFPLKAPHAGTVVACEVVAGEVVDTNKVLFVVADVERMWLTLNLRQEDAKHLKVGQTVRFETDGGRTEVSGKVAWASTAVDEKTRTIKVRVNVTNSEGKLRANTFGTGKVILREEKNAIVVPKEAVQWEGCCNVVFVRDKDFLRPDAYKVFHVRQVRPGARDEQYVELLAGVLPGEVVVTKGTAVLRAELLKSKLGAG